MAGAVNKVILIGNLGRDPEVRYLDNQRAVANFAIATSETYTNRNGEKVTNTEWHNIEMWDALAKVAEKYLKKGDSVYVEGQLKTEKWTSKETNEPRSRVVIRARSMQMLGGKSSGMTENSTAPVAQSNEPQKETSNSSDSFSSNNGEQEDDLPF